MNRRSRHSKPIALFFLLTLSIQTFYPTAALALTSGPAQPESKAFTQAGTADMVDLFTGNFNYNLPLLDVDGYPVNLGYQSGVNIDDEAGWVGLGWNLNVGAINRQLRGLPDDAKGDIIQTQHYMKPKITVGGRVNAKLELFGNLTKDRARLNGTLTLGIFSDNYNGIGAELGANAGLSYTTSGSGWLTAQMGVSMLSSTSSGVDVTPSVSLALNKKLSDDLTVSPRLSASLGYNSRAGLKDLTLGTSFSLSGEGGSANYDIAGSVISYNTDPVYPKVQIPYRSNYGSFSFDLGGAFFGSFPGAGGSGYRAVREVKSRNLQNPGYGFLYAEAGKDNPEAIMDFIREKDNLVIPELPNLAIPVHTPDLFSYTSQAGSGQFRLYRGGTGILFDNLAEDESFTQTLGFDAGVGGYAHGGVSLYDQTVNNKTEKWTANNSYLQNGDFQEHSMQAPNSEHVYFRHIGEKSLEDEQMLSVLQGDKPVALNISGKTAESKFRVPGTPGLVNISTIAKTNKQARRTMVSYLTAGEMSLLNAKQRKIKSYPFNNAGTFEPEPCHKIVPAQQIDYTAPGSYRKGHHIGQITVTDASGTRNVYGHPVYNILQEECSFAIGDDYDASEVAEKNLVPFLPVGWSYVPNHFLGTDHYYHKEVQPAYASSYLLSGILSADYVDVTGDGITDDDLGTAVKFNYSKLSQNYKWRSPLDAYRATLNRGLLADPDDDKASYIYGEKELWYLHSIESKNKIAYFITSDRYDGLGVGSVLGGVQSNTKQKVLTEIRLYSKADLTRPIKTVKLEYGYDLCQQVPNFDPSQAVNFPSQGKLTLKKVYFLYGNTQKGMAHPYEFHYNNEEVSDPFVYGYLKTDRWGAYKAANANASDGFSTLRNDEYPYSTQNKSNADLWCALWYLKQIKLPTGGEINISYESDDYAYVQNRRAMAMKPIEGLIKEGGVSTTSLKEAKGLKLSVEGNPDPGETAINWFKRTYLNGSEYLYTKLFANVSDNENSGDNKFYDFIPCYAKVVQVNKSGNSANVYFETISVGSATVNPVIHSAWQRMRMEYPRYAYPGYKNRVKDDSFNQSLKAAVTAISNAAKNLDELRRNFSERAYDENFASKIKLEKSFVRLVKADGKKLGGGSRVKKIRISDNWSDMSGNTNTYSAAYGQAYEYTTQVDGVEISSGVAAFEPAVGGDENAMREPIPYVQHIRGAINNYYHLEEPLCESFFPAPTVGYSRVIVRDLDKNGDADPGKRTGSVVNEFYTAREFPVQVKTVSNQRNEKGPSGWYSLFGSHSIHELTYSQGYSVELNDMHGKPKSVIVLNQSGSAVSSTRYHYNAENLNAGEMKLKNQVSVVAEDGSIKENRVIGRDIELFTDMREQETTTIGESINLGADVISVWGVPVPFPHWPKKGNDEYRLFRSAVTVKVIQYYGIIDKVVKTENGSSITTENIAYDGLTGEAIVSHTINEFEKPVYNVNIPAYWIGDYKGMGGAYKTEGSVISLTTNASGKLTDPAIAVFLQAGDLIIDLEAPNSYYTAMQTSSYALHDITVIDKVGLPVLLANKPAKIIRSGYRNMLLPATTSVVCLTNPITVDPVRGKILDLSTNKLLTSLKVLSASTTLFDENWALPACLSCPAGFKMTAEGQCREIPIENTDACFTFCQGNVNAIYGIDGAAIKQTSSSTPVIRKSDFWGGACNTECNTSARTGSKGPIQPGDNLPLISFDSTGLSNNDTPLNMSPMYTPPGACTRDDYDPNVDYCGDNRCGRLIASGIWVCLGRQGNHQLPQNEWIGFETCIDIPTTKEYFIGHAADDFLNIYIDDVLWGSQLVEYNFQTWHVYPITLSAGKHKLKVEFRSYILDAIAGVEIYNNTYSELIDPDFDEEDANIIFSTARDIAGEDVQAYRNGIPKYSCASEQEYDVCSASPCGVPLDPIIVNPYQTGFSGNWRPIETKTYQVNRNYSDLFNDEKKGVNLKEAGYFDAFKPYWHFNSSSAWWEKITPEDDKWVTTNTITLYDKYGRALENKDALGRYSAATFNFRGDLPGSVASNSRYREIYFDSFEDTRLRSECLTQDTSCNLPVFKVVSPANSKIGDFVTTDNAHSGNYSLLLPSAGIVLSTIVHQKESRSEAYLEENTAGALEKKMVPGLYPIGFEPVPQKKYLLSFWTNSGNAPSIEVNGTSLDQITPVVSRARVEGWSQYEVEVDLAAISFPDENLDIVITPSGSNTLIDDIRISPFDAHMKSYAYDEKTLRLMAEMDENNFATFYEYDDEGSLVRVKKETERGIMTIKETRSSYRKQSQ